MDWITFWPLALLLLSTGLVAGLIAGLLGVGGGIVLVPVLDLVLRYLGVPPEGSMHVAIATSLATIIPTAIASSRAHAARDGIDWSLVKSWLPGLLLGGLVGSALAARATAQTLAGVFAVVAILVAVKMVLPLDHWRLRDSVPRGIGGNLIATLISTVSTMMGIGGGTLSVPVMTLTGSAIHRAVGTAAFFGLALAVPGTIGYLLADPPVDMPGTTVGLISLSALIAIVPTSTWMAPVGARLAHRLDRRRLSQVFGVFLCLVAGRMLFRSLSP